MVACDRHPEIVAAQAAKALEREAAVERAVAARLASAGIPARFRGGFPTFDRAKQPGAYKAVMTWANKPDGWLVLTGPVATGKTHLATAAALRLIEYGHTVVFADSTDLCARLRDFSDVHAAPIYQRADVLILDDLGTESRTSVTDSGMFRILNYRYANNRPTLLTTNLTIGQIAQWDGWERIVRRIEECARVIQLRPDRFVHRLK